MLDIGYYLRIRKKERNKNNKYALGYSMDLDDYKEDNRELM
jgi:hypothetical protein